MKKIISVILAVLMLACVCVPSFAATITADGSSTSIVKTKTVDEGGDSAENFTVTIPATTEIPWGKASTDLQYSVESHLAYGKKLSVNVAGNGVMTYTVGADAMTLAYSLGGDASFLAAGPVVYPAADKTLSVNVTDNAWKTAVVGEYQDTLTFTVAVV